MITESDDTEDRVLALGRSGLGRQEIAAALGMTLAEVGEREAGDAGFARALALAEEAARAWWGALQREAMSAGARFGPGAWREAMGWRFGDGEPAASAAPEAPPAPIDILADFDIPDNGRGPRKDGLSQRDDPDACKAADLAAAQKKIDRLTRQIAELNEELEYEQGQKEDIEGDDYRLDYDYDDED
jgi:hypothetical protein